MLASASADPLVPPWLAFPVAAMLVVVIALHIQSLKHAEMPASRKRIRSVNGWLMLVTTPLTAYAFGAATPQNPRLYVLVWLSVAGFLAMVMLLACLDVLNNRRLHRGAQRELRDLTGQLGSDLFAAAGGRPRPDESPRKDGGADGG